MQEAVNFSSGMTGATRRHAWLILLGLSVMFCLSVLWRPSDNGIILCPFRALTGYPCPGCGMTRAFSALAHGEPLRAILYNPLSPILFVAAILVWMSAAATILNLHGIRAALARLRPSTQVSYMFLGLMLTWWIVRLAGGF
jgi:Protein of unknown function (DUF2752)